MHFRGQTLRLAARAEVLRTTGSATSCVVMTSGFPACKPISDLPKATWRCSNQNCGSRVRTSFRKTARLRSVTRTNTCSDSQPSDGAMSALVSNRERRRQVGGWTAGEGQFASARGFITSAFTISNSGERSDFHCSLIFVPE